MAGFAVPAPTFSLYGCQIRQPCAAQYCWSRMITSWNDRGLVDIVDMINLSKNKAGPQIPGRPDVCIVDGSASSTSLARAHACASALADRISGSGRKTSPKTSAAGYPSRINLDLMSVTDRGAFPRPRSDDTLLPGLSSSQKTSARPGSTESPRSRILLGHTNHSRHLCLPRLVTRQFGARLRQIRVAIFSLGLTARSARPPRPRPSDTPA